MSFTVEPTAERRIVVICAGRCEQLTNGVGEHATCINTGTVITAIEAIEQIAAAANMTPLQVADGLGRRRLVG